MEDLQALLLFNKQAEKLKNSARFIEVFNSGLNFEIHIDSYGSMQRTENFPDDELLGSVLLKIRMFIQDNESISLRKMSQRYESMNITQVIKDKFQTIRNELNKFLDTTSGLVCNDSSKSVDISNPAAMSNRQVMDAYMYGEYAHLTPDKLQKVQQIASDPFFESTGKYIFIRIIGQFMVFVVHAASINEEAIHYLQVHENQASRRSPISI